MIPRSDSDIVVVVQCGLKGYHSNIDLGNHMSHDHYHDSQSLQSATKHEVIADYGGESIDQLDKPPHTHRLHFKKLTYTRSIPLAKTVSCMLPVEVFMTGIKIHFDLYDWDQDPF